MDTKEPCGPSWRALGAGISPVTSADTVAPVRIHGTEGPFLLGCFFVVTTHFPGLGEIGAGVTLAHAIMAMGLPFWFAATVTRVALPFDRTAVRGVGVILACVAFLIVWAFLSVIGSGTPLRSGRSLSTLVAAFAAFFLIAGTVTRRRFDIMVAILCFTLAVTCVISLVGYFEPGLRGTIYHGGDRAWGFFKNPNQFGMTLSMLLPVATAIVLGTRTRRLPWVLCLIALLIGLILSGSKMNLLIACTTLVFMVGVYPALVYRGKKRVFMVGFSLAVAGILLMANAAFLWMLNPRALLLMTEFFAGDGELNTLSARSELWQLSITQFRIDPVFGQGAGHPLDPRYADSLVSHSHNVLLDYLRVMGAPGFFGMLVVILTILVLSADSVRLAFRARWAYARDRILCVGLATGSVSYLAANFSSDSMGPSTTPVFWTVVFLGLAARGGLAPRRNETTG